jgi:hypothetical protein
MGKKTKNNVLQKAKQYPIWGKSPVQMMLLELDLLKRNINISADFLLEEKMISKEEYNKIRM